AATATAFFYIPLWSTHALHPFEGDAVVVLYLLTIPALCFFLAGWFSTSLFASYGAIRTLTSLISYEVPLFMAILSPMILAGTWSLSGTVEFYQSHPTWPFFNVLGFVVAIVALLGKLEKAPFDIPEAETELGGGTFVEYSGKLLALFRMTIDIEAMVVATLVASVFMPWGMNLHPVLVLALHAVKVFFIVFLIALTRTVMARMRIEQMVNFCYKWLAPAAIIQLLITILLSGVLK
ncbi:MAG TPA: complex I subunit 1 family protein, partial [Anaeromyxobacteraceae bacterium]|nr:complex I subunit 1 family protein [Anaeromyxobacteraceae bacterium]